jgi:AcrR family transcriptional regulator
MLGLVSASVQGDPRPRRRPDRRQPDRRREIAAAAHRVIDRLGMDGASMREIAREAGCTTGSLTHHFSGRRELLDYAVGVVCEESTDRLVATARSGSLLDALAEYLPLDEPRRLEAVIWVLGIAEAARDPRMAASLARRSAATNDLIAEALGERLRREGRQVDDEELGLVVDEIVCGADGIAASALSEPDRYPPQRQLELARRLLARMDLLGP